MPQGIPGYIDSVILLTHICPTAPKGANQFGGKQRMKKILLSAAAFTLVVVSSIALMPTKAEAIPAFARQTGAACLSCHFQTFPALTPFGRAFKYGSFTDVGDQALIEDDHLSIPAVLNATFVLRGNYTNINVSGTGSVGTWTIPADAVIMMAGRVGTNSGAFIEYDAGPANWQFLNSVDMGSFKLGLGAHSSGFGGSGVLEVSNVFGQHGGKLNGKAISAIQNAGFAQATTGIAGWIGNDLGYIQLGLVAPAAATQGLTNVGFNLGKLVRVVGTFDLGGWDTLIGFGSVSGTAGKQTAVGGIAGVLGARIPMDMQFADIQFQGEIGDMTLGVYGDWAHVKGKGTAATGGNFYGGGVVSGQKFDAYSLRAELKPLDRIMFGLGYGYNKTSLGGALGNTTVKTLQLAGTYEIYQNFEINLVYASAKTTTGGLGLTTRTFIAEFEALM